MLYYTGNALSAAEAFDFGLVAQVVPAAELETRVNELAAAIGKNSANGIRMTKEVINTHTCGERAAAVGLEAYGSYVCIDCEDTRSRMQAFFASRKKK